jgi:hypothetical protein
MGRVDFSEMQATAREVRAHYSDLEIATYGRAWTREEIMLGFPGDVGDLAKLVQGKEGMRPRHDLDAALAHELADCPWCVLTLADALPWRFRAVASLPDADRPLVLLA